MGKRSRRFRCSDCERMFWEWFEHCTLNELRDKVNTKCEYCSSENIEITSETRFSGGDIGYRHYQRFSCRNCLEDFYAKVGEKSADEIKHLADELECLNEKCDSSDLRLTDSVIKRTEMDEYDVVHPVEEEPEDTFFIK